MRDKKAPTLTDVARAAGVSPYTVSVVLNGARSNTRVSEATRARILESAAALRYHPNAMARSLVKRRASAIGVLFSVVESTEALANPYASGLLQGIVTRAAHRGYDVLLYNERWQDAAHSAARYRDRRTDGVIVVAPLTDTDIVPGLALLDIPLVAVSAASVACPPGTANVDVDNALGVRLAVEHLLAGGHRRIAHLMGNENVASVPLRRQAFLDVMAEAGLSVPEAYVVPCTYDATTVGEALDHLLRRPEPPTALLAGNDNIAIAALNYARENNLSVPEELSVVGFDDIPAASQVTPRLTTVHQPLHEIGGAAADTLIDRIEGAADAPAPAGDGSRYLEPSLVIRESTGPAPAPGKERPLREEDSQP
jgi:Transcriptional regulators